MDKDAEIIALEKVAEVFDTVDKPTATRMLSYLYWRFVRDVPDAPTGDKKD